MKRLGLALVALMIGGVPIDATGGVRQEVKEEKKKPVVTPLLSAGVYRFKERTRLELSNGTADEDKSMWMAMFSVGLRYPLSPKKPSVGEFKGQSLVGEFKGQSLVGAGFVFRPGDWPVRVDQEFVWDFRMRHWLRLSWGLGFGAILNGTRWSRSSLYFGVPLAIRLGWVSFVYAPGATVSIAKSEKAVYDGKMTQRVATGLTPIFFCLRLHLPRVGW